MSSYAMFSQDGEQAVLRAIARLFNHNDVDDIRDNIMVAVVAVQDAVRDEGRGVKVKCFGGGTDEGMDEVGDTAVREAIYAAVEERVVAAIAESKRPPMEFAV